jgi:hypothetical protein
MLFPQKNVMSVTIKWMCDNHPYLQLKVSEIEKDVAQPG